MKGPQPLHIQSAAAACTQQGWKPFGLPSRQRRPRTAKSKILTPRRRSGPSGRFLYHFPSRPNLGFAGLGFRFCGALWAVLEPPAAQSAAFDFSPRAAFHLPGVSVLRSACSARPATRREYARQIYDLPSLVALRAPSKRCPRTSSRVNAASDRPSPKVTKEGGR